MRNRLYKLLTLSTLLIVVVSCNKKGKVIDTFLCYYSNEIVEKQYSMIDIMALVEFNGVNLLGSISLNESTKPNSKILLKKKERTKFDKKQGSQLIYVKIKKCGISGDKIFYEFRVVRK